MRSIKKLVARGNSGVKNKNEIVIAASGDDQNVKDKKSFNTRLNCKIRLLDDSQAPFDFVIPKEDLGQRLFSLACEAIGDLVERDYFGLRYTDKFGEEQWLDLSKSAYKQLKGCKSNELFFRLKHYPLDPINDLKQKFARYLVYLQIRRDLSHGRLLCPSSMVATVGALVAQAELGDAPLEEITELEDNCPNAVSEGNPTSPEHTPFTHASGLEPEAKKEDVRYLRDLKIFVLQTREMEAEIAKKHRHLRGLTPQEAETELLNRVCKFPTYGVHPFPVVPHHKVILPPSPPASSDESSSQSKLKRAKSSPVPGSPESRQLPKDTNFYIDVTGSGLVFYAGLKRIQEYSWPEILRLRCDGKEFIVNLNHEQSISSKRFFRNKTRQVTFDCASQAAALALWRWAVERRCFFTLKEAKQAKRLRPTSNIFHRSHTYRFCGRSYQELSTISVANSKDNFIRIASLRQANRPLSASVGHSTLPERLRPKLDLHEEYRSGESLVRSEPLEDSVEAVDAVIVPNSITDQPTQEEPVTVIHLDVQEQKKMGNNFDDSKENQENVEEIAFESNHVSQNLPAADRATFADQTKNWPHQDSMEIRKRVDSDMIHAVVYQQVVSALDHTIDDHVEDLNSPIDPKSDAIPNGSIHINNIAKTTTTDSFQKKHVYSSGNPTTEENKHAPTLDKVKKGVSIGPGGKASVTVVVVVLLIGLITMLETTPDTNSTVLRFIRSNALVSGFDSYVYTPVRNAIINGLSPNRS